MTHLEDHLSTERRPPGVASASANSAKNAPAFADDISSPNKREAGGAHQA